MKRILSSLLLILGSLSAANASELVAENAWVRMPPPVSSTAAAYTTLYNHDEHGVTIIGVESDVAGMTMLHGMLMEGGKMKMFDLGEVSIPAHGSLNLAPGGSHIMLMDLHQPLHAGDMVHITLTYNDHSTQTFAMMVKDARQMEMNHGNGHQSMSHEGMHH